MKRQTNQNTLLLIFFAINLITLSTSTILLQNKVLNKVSNQVYQLLTKHSSIFLQRGQHSKSISNKTTNTLNQNILTTKQNTTLNSTFRSGSQHQQNSDFNFQKLLLKTSIDRSEEKNQSSGKIQTKQKQRILVKLVNSNEFISENKKNQVQQNKSKYIRIDENQHQVPNQTKTTNNESLFQIIGDFIHNKISSLVNQSQQDSKQTEKVPINPILPSSSISQIPSQLDDQNKTSTQNLSSSNINLALITIQKGNYQLQKAQNRNYFILGTILMGCICLILVKIIKIMQDRNEQQHRTRIYIPSDQVQHESQ